MTMWTKEAPVNPCWYCSHKARALKFKAKRDGLRPEKYA